MASPESNSSHGHGAATVKRRKKQQQDGDDRPKRQRIAIACIACRQRKAKCDGLNPCSSCSQAKLADCTYPATTKKIDPDYLQQLEKRIEELSGAVARTQQMGTPTQTQGSIEPPPTVSAVVQPQSVGSRTYSVSSDTLQPQITPNMHSEGLKAESAAGDPTIAPTLQMQIAPSGGARTKTADGHTLLTLIASPGVNSHFPDSSTRTLFDEVEGATRRLVGGPPGSASERPPKALADAVSAAHVGEGEGLQIFSHSKSQQDLYTLPHRELSDALVKIYRERIHSIFRILHWPTFMSQYENTFKAGGTVDKHWLGLLNQVYAIACQIGGPEIEAVEGTEAGLRFFQRSLAMMFPLVLQSRSLQALQCVLLMTQYLQSISQPSLCWNTVGHAVRFAQSQGLYSASTLAHMNPIEAETRRRVWAGVVAMEATTAATLGLPPSLSAQHCLSVEPTPVDDEYITASGIEPQPYEKPSVSSFIQQTYKVYAIQLRILSNLYSPHAESEHDWPNCRDILEYDRQLEAYAKDVPLHLRISAEGAARRGNNEELNMQTNVLRSRFLNAKILAHRPMLSYLCHRSQSDTHHTDALDQAITYASARICCNSAVEVIEVVTANWHNGQSGAWWYSLYYVYSASLVILASFVVDTISSLAAVACVADLPRATNSLRAALLYLSDKPEVMQGLMSPVVNQAARESVRSCYTMLTGIMKTLAGNSASPLKANTSKGDYHAALRASLDLPLNDDMAEPPSATLSGDTRQTDPYEDFWTLLSQTRPPSPQPVHHAAASQDNGFLGLGMSQPSWPNDFSLDSWQWPEGDFALQFPSTPFDNALKAAYTSQPAAPQQYMPTPYTNGPGAFTFAPSPFNSNNFYPSGSA